MDLRFATSCKLVLILALGLLLLISGTYSAALPKAGEPAASGESSAEVGSLDEEVLEKLGSEPADLRRAEAFNSGTADDEETILVEASDFVKGSDTYDSDFEYGNEDELKVGHSR